MALSSSLDNANRVSALAGKSSGLQRIIFVFNMLLVSILLLLLPPQTLPCLNVPPYFADGFFGLLVTSVPEGRTVFSCPRLLSQYLITLLQRDTNTI